MVISEVSNMLGYKQLDSQKDLFEFELNSKKVKRTIVGFSLLTLLPVLFLIWWITNFLAAPTYPLHFILIFIIVSVIALGVLVHFVNQIKEGLIELKQGKFLKKIKYLSLMVKVSTSQKLKMLFIVCS